MTKSIEIDCARGAAEAERVSIISYDYQYLWRNCGGALATIGKLVDYLCGNLWIRKSHLAVIFS